MAFIKVALAQHAPVYLNLTQSLDKACALIEQAAAAGARLVVFGETWLCGYPVWLDYCSQAALWDNEPVKRIYALHRISSITVPGPACERLAERARTLEVVLAIGVSERVERGPGSGTLFNALLIFDEAGRLVVHHRKLVPTHGERLLWGPGDGAGLRAADTAIGRLGGLICWEHWMPLARHALHCSGEQIHIAMWPSVRDVHQMASRHYAFEARCHVLAVGSIVKISDIPDGIDCSFPQDAGSLALNGGSAVIGPDGRFVAEPVLGREELLMAELDLSQRDREVMALDVSGHYHRPDVFDFAVKRDRPEHP